MRATLISIVLLALPCSPHAAPDSGTPAAGAPAPSPPAHRRLAEARAAEALGDLSGALRTYRAVQKLRPSPRLEAHIAALRDRLRDPRAVRPMLGPFPTAEAACRALAAARATTPPTRCVERSVEIAPKPPPTLDPKSADFREVKLLALMRPMFESARPGGPGTESLHPAARTRAGWFVAARGPAADNPGAMGIYEAARVETFERREVGGRAWLWLEWTHERSDADRGVNEVESARAREVMPCALGRHDRPHCLGPFRLAFDARRGLLDPSDRSEGVAHDLWTRKASGQLRLHPDGTLELEQASVPGDPPDAARANGRWKPVFP